MLQSHLIRRPLGVWVILGATVFVVEALPFPSYAGKKSRKATAAERTEAPRPQWTEVGSSETERRVAAALSEQTEMEFVGIPLEDAFSYFSELHKLPIVADWTAIEELGVKRDKPVSLALSGVQLRSALNLILEPLGLSYVVEDEVLKIVPEAKAAESLIVRIYDVRRLEESGLAPEDLAETVKTTIEPESWKAGITKVRLLDDKKTVALHHGKRVLELWDGMTGKQIIRLGGEGKTGVAALPGFLVIRQTRRAHEQIADLLEGLEKLARTSSR